MQRLAVFGLCLLLTIVAKIAEGQSSNERGGERPSITALAIDSTIELDGRLDEEAWQRAEVSGGFTQREPDEYEPSSESTEIRVVYTPKTLYIGIDARDSQPELVIGREMGRDSPLFRDDGLVLLLDTFHDQRNAYFFETNPNSSRTDGLVTDEGRDFNTDWDGIWNVESRRTARGWVAEFAIPFSTLRFDPEAEVWGLQVRRIIKRKSEVTFWSPIGRDADLFRMSQAGALAGLQGMETGRNLRLKPFLTASSAREFEESTESDDEAAGGLDVKWAVTQGLTLDLTVNTDFAETEVDEQQTNLTRFSLFFPEKREFFLENSGIFEFGPDRNGPPLMKVFFSRRIGIDDEGRLVDLDFGARLAGRAGPWSLGVLGVRTGGLSAEPEDEIAAVPENDWGVVRVKRNLGERSNIGMIATSREGSDGSYHRVYGFDADVKPNDRLGLWAYGAASEGSAEDADDWAGGVGASFQGSFWEWSAGIEQIGEDFTAESGFLRRSGRNYRSEVEYAPRPDWDGVRNLSFEVEADVFTFEDGELESVESSVDLFGLETDQGDFFLLFGQWNYENIVEPFEIFDDVVIPEEEYRWADLGIFFRTNEGRPVAMRGSVIRGDFYDGTRFATNLTLHWRPSRWFRSETSWNHNDIDLPAGAFEVNILRQRFGVSVHPDLVFDAFLQHNDVNDSLTMNLRANWHYRPGSDLFLVYNHGWDAPGFSDLRSQDRQVILKATYSWDL